MDQFNQNQNQNQASRMPTIPSHAYSPLFISGLNNRNLNPVTPKHKSTEHYDSTSPLSSYNFPPLSRGAALNVSTNSTISNGSSFAYSPSNLNIETNANTSPLRPAPTNPSYNNTNDTNRILRTKHSPASLSHSARSKQPHSPKSPNKASPERAFIKAGLLETKRSLDFGGAEKENVFVIGKGAKGGERPPKARVTLGPLMNRKLMREEEFMPRMSLQGSDRDLPPTSAPNRNIPSPPFTNSSNQNLANHLLTPPPSAPRKKTSLMKLSQWLTKTTNINKASTNPGSSLSPNADINNPVGFTFKRSNKPQLTIQTDRNLLTPFPHTHHQQFTSESSSSSLSLSPYPSSSLNIDMISRSRVESSVFEFKDFEGTEGVSPHGNGSVTGNAVSGRSSAMSGRFDRYAAGTIASHQPHRYEHGHPLGKQLSAKGGMTSMTTTTAKPSSGPLRPLQLRSKSTNELSNISRASSPIPSTQRALPGSLQTKSRTFETMRKEREREREAMKRSTWGLNDLFDSLEQDIEAAMDLGD